MGCIGPSRLWHITPHGTKLHTHLKDTPQGGISYAMRTAYI
jgi:hypothetical protein